MKKSKQQHGEKAGGGGGGGVRVRCELTSCTSTRALLLRVWISEQCTYMQMDKRRGKNAAMACARLGWHTELINTLHGL